MTNGSGTVVWRADYKPFGEADVDEDPDGNGIKVTMNLRFPGQYFDKETGLHYNYHRYYHWGIGRYLRADPIDPIGLAGGINLYPYVLNNPINWVDPWGLSGEDKWRKEVPWWERPFWEPRGEQIPIWEWEVVGTFPQGEVLSAGYQGPVEVHWRNRFHYEQWGVWIWEFNEYRRKWGYRWGEKTVITKGWTYPLGGYHGGLYWAPEPQESPEPCRR
jgi:RHS repeat-associated protein